MLVNKDIKIDTHVLFVFHILITLYSFVVIIHIPDSSIPDWDQKQTRERDRLLSDGDLFRRCLFLNYEDSLILLSGDIYLYFFLDKIKKIYNFVSLLSKTYVIITMHQKTPPLQKSCKYLWRGFSLRTVRIAISDIANYCYHAGLGRITL